LKLLGSVSNDSHAPVAFRREGPAKNRWLPKWSENRNFFTVAAPSILGQKEKTDGPCVDGSGLARRIFTCSVGRSSHVFGLLARFT
jgi:hypothetical protein